MKILALAVLAVAAVFASLFLSFSQAHSAEENLERLQEMLAGGHHHKKGSSAKSSANVDFLRGFHDLMCSTGSKYCISHPGQVDFPTFRHNIIHRGLEFAHEMMNPKTIAQKMLHAALPTTVQDLFRVAKKFAHKHQVADIAPELAHHKASARAIMDAWKEMTGNVDADKYSYFGWLPQWAGDAQVGGSTSFATSCVGEITVSTVLSGTTLTVTTTASKDGFFCDDMLLLLVGDGGFRLQVVDKDAPLTWQLDVASFTQEQKWYMARHGARVLKFPKGLIDTVGQLVSTLTMLAGFAESPLTNQTLTDNIQFLKDYVESSPRMQPYTAPRSAGSTVGYAIADTIQSGDSFIVMRPDGLDPMIGWGEGWTSGHSTIAMRDLTNSSILYVCESTSKDAYWAVNGIQCTLYDEWIARYTQAQQTVLHAPLTPEYRAKFNAAAAWNFFRQHDGLNYGFANFLFGWVDTENNNFPCLPPDYKTCLMKEAVEQLAFILDKLLGDQNTNIFRQAINFRAGTQGQPVLGAFYSAVQKEGSTTTFSDIYTRVEQDTWLYNMTWNNGTTTRAQCSVCCVFVCRMWKAAGIFSEINDELNCGEQTLWDIFSMGVYDTSKMGNNRPEICKSADPNNQLCQLTGPVTLHAKPDFNTRKLYKHMGENCGSLAPDYIRAPGC